MQVIEYIKEPVVPPRLVEQTIPIAFGVGMITAWRDPFVKMLPAGFVAKLGKFAAATGAAIMGTLMALFSGFVLPKGLKPHGYTCSATMWAFAGYDTVTALIGGSSGSPKETAATFETPSYTEYHAPKIGTKGYL